MVKAIRHLQSRITDTKILKSYMVLISTNNIINLLTSVNQWPIKL